MERKISTYKKWAPDDSVWSAWAKPVLFASLNSVDFDLREIKAVKGMGWADSIEQNTAIILDLPGKTGVEVSIEFARRGYRPVPLYNGCKGPNSMLVNVNGITKLLYSGAKILEELPIRTDAAPVFMLDSERMDGYSTAPGKYDNRWCLFAQDMPSGKFLREKGIDKVLVYAEKDTIKEDLSHVLCRYQEEGIQILLVKNNFTFTETTVKKPSRFKSLMYRFSIILGLRRNSTGGFGGRIPEPMEHNAGIGYRGIG